MGFSILVVNMDKKEIRREVIAKRDLLKNKSALDKKIEEKLRNNEIYKNSKNIFKIGRASCRERV